jgi:hypothetical protein
VLNWVVATCFETSIFESWLSFVSTLGTDTRLERVFCFRSRMRTGTFRLSSKMPKAPPWKSIVLPLRNGTRARFEMFGVALDPVPPVVVVVIVERPKPVANPGRLSLPPASAVISAPMLRRSEVREFGDRRLDEHLRTALVEFLDERENFRVAGLRRGEQQRVVVAVGDDGDRPDPTTSTSGAVRPPRRKCRSDGCRARPSLARGTRAACRRGRPRSCSSACRYGCSTRGSSPRCRAPRRGA